MTPATMAELAKLPNIIGVKDATGDLSRPLNTYLACGADFCQLSGEDCNGHTVPVCRWVWLYFSNGKHCTEALFRHAKSLA